MTVRIYMLSKYQTILQKSIYIYNGIKICKYTQNNKKNFN